VPIAPCAFFPPVHMHTPTRKDQQGQAVVEMAIILPVLMILLLSIWQFGVVYDKWQNLNGAAREGARAAIVAPQGQELSQARAAANASVAGQLTLSSFSLTSTTVAGTPYYTATACSTYSVNILGIVVKSGNLCRDATMRVE
jgi:Flp pilus assembly protein TadG